MNFPRLGGPPLTPSAAVRIPQSLADAKAGPGATKATGASTGQESSLHARGQRASFLHKGSKHKAPSFGTPSTSPTCTLPRQKQPGKAKGALREGTTQGGPRPHGEPSSHRGSRDVQEAPSSSKRSVLSSPPLPHYRQPGQDSAQADAWLRHVAPAC